MLTSARAWKFWPTKASPGCFGGSYEPLGPLGLRVSPGFASFDFMGCLQLFRGVCTDFFGGWGGVRKQTVVLSTEQEANM